VGFEARIKYLKGKERGMSVEKKKAKEECEKVCGPSWLIKFGRLCAWLLVVFIILYFISGFGMIKQGIFSRELSFRIHDYLTIPMTIAFLCHALIAIRSAMIRWRVKNMKVVDHSLMALGVILFALTMWAYFG
jgi:succinate dehydrogenase/fumarate reductase cytochrome b subunit